MSVDEVLREMRTDEMRESRRILTQELDEWADVIEAAMREKDAEVEAAREWLRKHAEIDKAKSAEIERLREALKRIKANRYGLQSLTENGADEKAIAEYWANTAMEYQQIARTALLEVKNV